MFKNYSESVTVEMIQFVRLSGVISEGKVKNRKQYTEAKVRKPKTIFALAW